ncbi:VOC family protein [Natronorubrum daqingense]|uniref:Lactoylglutathione lyase n=1 Tax=Natronorubrum daqingense TaxID=588898 RepID=A0A1N7ES56_9EURY|nr:VOC family protein [Natronorubrum daqingense]APX97752.1 lactoylglutathione lyase [Natronorubrum daqingense]SIR90892.1 lactoylglutathione lyase [Natronorubrum daqingense]
MDVLHTAVWIDDVDSVMEFYCEGLDLERTRDFVGDDGVTNYYVQGEAEAEIQFKHDADRNLDLEPSGIDHIAIGVDDVESTLERLVEGYDSEVVDGPRRIERSNLLIAFVTDPSGYVVELIESLDE